MAARQITPSGNHTPFRVFAYATTWDVLACTAGALASIGSGITQPLLFALFGSFTSQFSSFATRNTDRDLDEFQKTINGLCLRVFALFFAHLVLTSIHKFAFQMISIRLSAAIKLNYLSHLFSQSIHVLDSIPPGHAAGTITSSSNALQIGLGEKLGTLIEYKTRIVAAFIAALTWNWELSLVTASGFVAVIVIIGSLFPLTVNGRSRQRRSEGQAASIASETLASIRMLMACGGQREMVRKYGASVDDAKRHARASTPFTALQFALVLFGVFATMGLCFWHGTRMFAENRLDDIGVIITKIACCFHLPTLFFSLQRISAPMQAIGNASLAACEFFAVIDAPLSAKGSLTPPNVSATEDIVFDKVTFAYPSRPDVKVLDHLDLRIEAGKTTAIVGPSGAGKSTVVGLILGWYTLTMQHGFAKAVQRSKKKNAWEDHNDGSQRIEVAKTGNRIELEGAITTCRHSLDDLDVNWWRPQIGLVQQEPFLFNDTVYENVARGLTGSKWEDEPEEKKRDLVREACQEAFADGFINKLPQGYDTMVGDGGTRLSGGQRQRIAIARAIIRKPAILFLDEATSAIDVHGEKIVRAALDKATRGRTTIMIAHRLSTIRDADRIVALKEGRMIESGTHESLLSINGGIYCGLVDAQNLHLSESSTNTACDRDVDMESLRCEATQTGLKYQGADPDDDKIKAKASRGFFKAFGLLFFESKQYWPLMALSLVFSAAAGTAQPVFAWMLSKSIDLFRWQDSHAKLIDEAEFLAIVWTVFAASVGTAYFLTFISSGRVASFIRAKYQTQYFESLIFQRAAYFDEDSHSHGMLTSRIRDDPLKLEQMLDTNIAQLFIAVFDVIAGVAMAVAYGWKLALVSLAAVTPVCVVSGYIRFRYELQFDEMDDTVFVESSKFASEAIGAFRTVSALTLERPIQTEFEKLCQEQVVSVYKKARLALIFYYGGQLLTRGEIGIMGFFVCLMAIIYAAEAFGQTLSFGPNAAQAGAASNRILEARKSRLVQGYGKDDIPGAETGISIELRGVSLRYPGRETPALDRVNITIEKGQFAALVGASGSGKTSVISLIERFYEPSNGTILCNGKDIADLDVYTYRKHLALVAQEPILFQVECFPSITSIIALTNSLGTIRENILLGMDSPRTAESQLHAACTQASIHDFISSLPDRYNTDIGSRGITLSGGQKQRIAVARALIRNPKILLLDEATSSLDSESERIVQADFERVAKGRTMIVVAHRLATVQNADVIFVLGGGGVVLERGSHGKLIKRRGVYYRMCQNQALDQ
ncbi:hypothetical protein BDV12DRAFT_210806 [Aspergillus spectabilis]